MIEKNPDNVIFRENLKWSSNEKVHNQSQEFLWLDSSIWITDWKSWFAKEAKQHMCFNLTAYLWIRLHCSESSLLGKVKIDCLQSHIWGWKKSACSKGENIKQNNASFVWDK